MKTFYKKLEYCFSVESNKIENASFQYKTLQTEANVYTNGIGSTKRIYRKGGSFGSNYYII